MAADFSQAPLDSNAPHPRVPPYDRRAAPGVAVARPFGPWRPRLAIVATAFLLAATVDVATGQTRSSLLGGTAIAVSIFALFPAWRVTFARAGCVAAIWGAFIVARGASDHAGLSVIGAGRIADIERRVFGGLPSARLQDLRPSGLAGSVLDVSMVAVYLSFFLIPIAMAMLVAQGGSDRSRRITASTGACLLLGTVGFLVFPTAPPWLADPGSVARMTPRVMSFTFGVDLSGGVSQPSSGSYSFEPNHLAAMPSIHVAATVTLAFVVASSWRRAAPFVWLHAAAMTFAVVYVGEHHVLDAAGGWAVALAGWRLAGHLVGSPAPRGIHTGLPAVREVTADLPARERHDDHRQRDQRGGRWRVGSDVGRQVGEGAVQRPDRRHPEVRRQPKRRQQPDHA